MTVDRCSLDAFRELERIGALARCEEIVLEHLKLLGRGTNQQLADLLGWTINRVTPRVKALREKGIVRRVGYIQSDQGRRCNVWGPA